MGLTFNLGRVSPSVFTDSSLNVGIGAAPSGTYKLEVTGTAKVSSTLLVSGAATFSDNVLLAATKRLYLSGTSYIQEVAAGMIRLAPAGNDSFDITSSALNIWVPTKIYGDGESFIQQANSVNSAIFHSFYNSASTRRAYLGYGSNSSSIFNVWNQEDGDIIFGTNNTEKARITSGGKVLIPSGGSGASYFSMNYTSANAASREWQIGSDQTAWGAFSIAQATTQGGTSFSDKLVIKNNGNAGIGITTGTYNGRLCIEGSDSSTSNIHLEFLTDTNRSYIQSANRTFIANAPLTIESSSITLVALGSGAVTATSGVLSTSSDMNLKIEDGYIDNALEKVLKLIPRYFLWKEESGLPTDLRQLGFYAQEVNEALGEEVANTPKTENDSWGIYDRGVIAMLTKAIQELKAEIDELKQK